MSDLQTLINIGPRTEALLFRIGIKTAEELLVKDPYELMPKLLKATSPLHCKFILASLAGAHVGLPWHKVFKQTSAEYEKKHPSFKWSKH